MPAIIKEQPRSRNQSESVFTTGNSSAEFRFVITGAASEVEARQLLAATVPSGAVGNAPDDTYNGMPRTENLLREGDDATLYYGTVVYRSRTTFAQSFSTGGGTFHLKQSLQTLSYAEGGGDGADHRGAINVGKDGQPAGVDVVVPQFRWSETHEIDNAVVTDEYIRKLAELTGTTNDATFRGFDPGEVLFEGANADHRGTTAWQIDFQFRAELNRVNDEIGSISGVSKKGHEYLWVEYGAQRDADGRLETVPKAAYVETVYPEGNFAELQMPVIAA